MIDTKPEQLHSSGVGCEPSPWSERAYIQHYYSEVARDERAALRYLIEALRGAGRRFVRAVEYGCGPTLMRAIAAAGYADAIDMADYFPSNLEQVGHWVNTSADADDWSAFTRYVLECEGVSNPDDELIRRREDLARGRIGELLTTDARHRHPLGCGRQGRYDLVLSGFCLESISTDEAVWRECVRNIASLLPPGGMLILFALQNTAAYRVGDHLIRACPIDRSDLLDALQATGFTPSSIDVQRSHGGHEGNLLASAIKAEPA